MIVDWLRKNGAIEESETALYQYALANVWYVAVPTLLSVIFGIALEVWWQTIVMILLFAIARKYFGGYHLNNGVVCLVISTIVLMGSVFVLYTHISGDIFCIPVYLLLVSAWVISPIDNKNKKFDVEERERYKKTCRTIVVAFGVLYTCMLYISDGEWLLILSSAILLSTLPQLPMYFLVKEGN